MNDPLEQRNHIVRAAIIWLVATAAMLVAFLFIAPQLEAWGVLPPIAATRTGEIDNVLWLFTVLSIPVFTLVVVFAGYSVFTFRSRGRPARDGALMRGNRGIQLTWVIVSIILVSFLFGYGLYFLGEVDAAPSGDVLQVSVTGEQWLWDYSYPQYNNASSTTLELPVGRPVTFTITSIDVQHSFWIPSFGIKQDAVPGEVTSISVTPSVVGDYVVRCAELCGLYHSYMETPVHVVSTSDFDAWIAQQPALIQPSAFQSPGVLMTAYNVTTDRRQRDAFEG